MCLCVCTLGSGSVPCTSSLGEGRPVPPRWTLWVRLCVVPPQFPMEAGGAGGSPSPYRLRSGGFLERGDPGLAFGLCHFLLCDLGSVSWLLWSLLWHLPEERDVAAHLTRLEGPGARERMGVEMQVDDGGTGWSLGPRGSLSGVCFSALVGWHVLLPELCICNLH